MKKSIVLNDSFVAALSWRSGTEPVSSCLYSGACILQAIKDQAAGSRLHIEELSLFWKLGQSHKKD